MAMRIDAAAVEALVGTNYPTPFHEPCLSPERQALGDAAGLTQFGVNLLRLPPGAWSSQRHWETLEDEFIYVLSGEVVLVTDAGDQVLGPGDAAGFKAGEPNGHHLQNRGTSDATVLEIGTRIKGSEAHYSDIDMVARADGSYARRTGEAYPRAERRGVKR